MRKKEDTMTLAPIILFVYNRPWHTRQTVEALRQNELASESELFVYSDGPKNAQVEPLVKEVREYLKTLDGFKKVTIIEREKNYGLAANIIDGVTHVMAYYGRAIVLEDDLVTGRYFLRFMNEALTSYENEKRVWHISGYNYPIEYDERDGDTYFSSLMDCWGWATWKDRWDQFDWKSLTKILFLPLPEKRRFDLWGTRLFLDQVYLNLLHLQHTWAIYWYATIFLHKGLCLHPVRSLVNNIGQDGTGMHGDDSGVFSHAVLDEKYPLRFPPQCEVDERMMQAIASYLRSHRTPLTTKVKKLLRLVQKKMTGGRR